MTTNRRQFLQETTRGVATAAALSTTASAAANDKFVIGVIGPGGMGSNHLKHLTGYADVEVAYICDVDAGRAATAAKLVENAKGAAPKVVTDLRKVLDDKTVDAVFIATLDHWHVPAMRESMCMWKSRVPTTFAKAG